MLLRPLHSTITTLGKSTYLVLNITMQLKGEKIVVGTLSALNSFYIYAPSLFFVVQLTEVSRFLLCLFLFHVV